MAATLANAGQCPTTGVKVGLSAIYGTHLQSGLGRMAGVLWKDCLNHVLAFVT